MEENHITTIKPDKCLMFPKIRNLFVGGLTIEKHIHEDRLVLFYPDEIFFEEDEGEKIFFVPAIPLNQRGVSLERRPVPIFMLNFNKEQRKEIQNNAFALGFEVPYKYFSKPQIAITYEERLEYEPVIEVE